jgi:hypothetical protein
VKKILLVSFRTDHPTRRHPNLKQSEGFRRCSNAPDGFVVKSGIAHNSALPDILALQFKLWLDQDQKLRVRIRAIQRTG